jgi:hypothetical protein
MQALSRTLPTYVIFLLFEHFPDPVIATGRCEAELEEKKKVLRENWLIPLLITPVRTAGTTYPE